MNMTEYLQISLKVDKLKRELQHCAVDAHGSPLRMSELFNRGCNEIREGASGEQIEWLLDRLQDVAFECGLAQFDSSVLRMVRAGIMQPDELFENEYVHTELDRRAVSA